MRLKCLRYSPIVDAYQSEQSAKRSIDPRRPVLKLALLWVAPGTHSRIRKDPSGCPSSSGTSSASPAASMKSARKAVLRQMMDWRAAIIAEGIAGMVYLVINMRLASKYLGNANVPLQLSAALVMGKSVLSPAEGIASGTISRGF